MARTTPSKRSALQFIILLGIVSLFADVTYEGARSLIGPYLLVLGANAALVGFVAGFGELVGYGVRLVSGYISDRTKQYWPMTILGYVVNLLSVPLLALTNNWIAASCLIIAERLGKAIRNPSRDALLSYATKEVGRGWGFGLHKALDQVGAITGPLIMAAVLYQQDSFQFGFAILLIPALFSLISLAIARWRFPQPQDLEPITKPLETKGFSSTFWLYVAAVSCVAAGYVDFPIMAYHFQKTGHISPVWIPLFYALAMGVDGLAALVCGRLFDLKGLIVLLVVTAMASLFAPFVFFGNFYFALVGMALWGIGLGVQESIMRAVVADLIPVNKRASAYGVLNMLFGVSWFLGSVLMGFLYDLDRPYLVLFSVITQWISLPLFWLVKNRTSQNL